MLFGGVMNGFHGGMPLTYNGCEHIQSVYPFQPRGFECMVHCTRLQEKSKSRQLTADYLTFTAKNRIKRIFHHQVKTYALVRPI